MHVSLVAVNSVITVITVTVQTAVQQPKLTKLVETEVYVGLLKRNSCASVLC